ncbi:MAG: hypothetical protein IT209_04295 [Armatimonadetes bacterium]|nr:hypothetical protein [Armatimonadota bacterium]
MTKRTLAVAFAAAAFLSVAGVEAAKVTIEKIPYFHQPNCYKLSNGDVDIIVTSDIGPRIIAYRFVGGDNMLAELSASDKVETEYGVWHAWGGHRLWHAPEEKPRSYVPDDSPVQVMQEPASIRLTQDTEKPTGIQKQMLVTLEPRGTQVTVTMTLTNKNLWAIDLAPWGLTIVKGGGIEVIPQEPFISHDEKLLPGRSMVLWNYTDLSDPRWKLGKKFVILKVDATNAVEQKLGFENKPGWAAYAVNGNLFVKRFGYQESATYPDQGCNYETYTAGNFIEMESLGPMVKLQPGQSVTHVEHWYLFKDIKLPESESAIDAALTPLLKQTAQPSK